MMRRSFTLPVSLPGQTRELTIVAIALAGAALIGALQVAMPVFGPALLVAAVATPLLLALDVKWIVLGTIALMLFSRLLIPYGAPPLINYAHFGFAILALLRLGLTTALGRKRAYGLSPLFVVGFVGFALVVVVSAFANGWYALRPPLFWLSICEPFLLLALTVHLDDFSRGVVRTVLIAFAVAQLPFAAMQFVTLGPGDPVQGTLVGLSGGAHVVGAICVIAALLILVDNSSRRGSRLSRLTLPLILFSVGLFSDAKQIYGALIVASIPFLFPLLRSKASVVIIAASSIGAILFFGARYFPALDQLFDSERISDFSDQKIDYFHAVNDEFGLKGMLLGLGPGNGLSRIALTTVPGYGHLPRAIVGSDPAQLAEQFITGFSGVRFSSAQSPFNSWLGIYADVGILGLVTYLILGAWAWRSLSSAETQARIFGRMLLVFAVILGVIFTWLEEPAFMVYLAVAIGTVPRAPQRYSPPESGR